MNVILVVGLALRVRQFLFNRSFWLDEAALAVSFGDRGFIELLTIPLKNAQSAPPLYIVLAKCSILLFGNHDWTLRLLPFAASIILLVFAYLLVPKAFSSLPARLLFLGLLSLSPVLIFYSVEFKPYGMDAALATLMLWALVVRSRANGAIWLAAAGFLGLCGSLPFFFLAAPAALLLAYEYIPARRYAELSGIAFAWIVGAISHLAYLVGAGTDRTYMTQWWQKSSGFPPAGAALQGISEWYVKSFVGFTHHAFRTTGTATPGLRPFYFDFIGITLASVCFLILVIACLRPKGVTLVSVAAIVLCMIAAGLKLYPFSSRLILGLVPPLFFLLASGIDVIDRANRSVAALLAGALICVCLPLAWQAAVAPVQHTAVKSALRELAQRIQPGDALALGRGTITIYSYYRDILPLEPATVPFGAGGDTSKLQAYVSQQKPKRLWVLMGHGSKRINRLLAGFNKVNRHAFDWRGPDTILLLYENPKPSAP